MVTIAESGLAIPGRPAPEAQPSRPFEDSTMTSKTREAIIICRKPSGTSTMLRYACRTSGLDCDAVFTTKTEEELINQINQHAIQVHGLEPSDLSPELMRQVKAKIERS